MVITRIAKMKIPGIFREFAWPSDLPDFSRYNLIYGWNATGKTTLSRIFRALEFGTASPKGEVTVTIDGQDFTNDDFAQVTLPIHVFNEDFVGESVFPTDNSDLKPIFVLGKKNVEKQKQAAQLKKTLADEQVNLIANWQSRTNASSALDKFCIDKAKVVKDMLRSSGPNPYNDYNKGDFSLRADDMESASNKDDCLLKDSERDKILAQLRESPKPKIDPLTYRLPDLKALERRVDELLSTTVVSKAIQSLKDDANLASWVHSGIGLHQERNSKICLFCNQLMPEDRLATLEAHFSANYKDLLRKLDGEIASIKAAIEAIMDVAIPNPFELYDDLVSDFESAVSALQGKRTSAKRNLDVLAKALEDKKARAFERVDLNVTISELNTGVVENLNGVIMKHNQVCDAFQPRIDSARKQFEAGSVASNLGQYLRLKIAVKAAIDEVTKADDKRKRLTEEIGKLEREIIDHLKPAEELNEDLRNYLGHGELQLKVNETGYTIMRNDTVAEFLSEGETTAIALLYFLKSLEDRKFAPPEGEGKVVVLDDPVSSLDHNALFRAFAFIRERTESAAQIIISTHNFTFFRLVRDWYKRAKRGAYRVYMLRCTHEANGRCTAISNIDKLLMEYDSEYHYLFSRVYKLAHDPQARNLGEYYDVPSIARRVLEMFLAFKVPGKYDLWKRICKIDFNEGKRSRIYNFLQTHSHRNVIGDADEDLSLLSESRSVLNDLLEFMEYADEKHVSSMIKLIEHAGDNGGQS